MFIIFRAWGVVSPKGNSVFIDQTRAMEYAGKHHGQVVDLSRSYEQKTSNNSHPVGQTGEDDKSGTKQLYPYPPVAKVFCEESGATSEGVSTCGSGCSLEGEGETRT